MSSTVTDMPFMARIAVGRRWLEPYWPTLMLVVASCFWGMGFSWAKNLGDSINRASGQDVDAPIGPLLGLTLRFGIATVIWIAVMPDSRRGWRWQTFDRGLAIGFALSLGLILQHIGLGLSDESVIAFLTNLTVIFVPAWVLLATKKWPSTSVLMSLPVALVGLVLLSGVWGSTGGTQAGVVWGVGCAAAFAVEILLLGRLARGRSVGRIGLMLFGTTAVMCGLMTYNMPGYESIQWQALVRPAILVDLVPLTLLTTLAAFGLMTKYQPKIEPTRAAVIYLLEPLFATAFAWWHNGRTLSVSGCIGAALILSANVIAEWRARRV